MNKIRDDFPPNIKDFFVKLQNYLDTELIFFGSIKRFDYFKNASDIDIAIISDNTNGLLAKLKNYLNIDNFSIKKIYQQYTVKDNNLVSGYKVKYEDESNNLIFDLLIYDTKYKIFVLKNINDINFLPFYMMCILYILKFIYYHLGIISKSVYTNIKCIIFYWYFNNDFKYYDKQNATTIILDNMIK